MLDSEIEQDWLVGIDLDSEINCQTSQRECSNAAVWRVRTHCRTTLVCDPCLQKYLDYVASRLTSLWQCAPGGCGEIYTAKVPYTNITHL